MSYTLLMRLAGPMQAWGVSSRFGIRETMTEPSKSGVIGLLCAALGWDRSATTFSIAGKSRTLTDLADLRYGVRVVQEGIIRRDYHTAQRVLRAKAKLRPGKPVADGDLQETVLSERYYLSDAYFLAGLESDDKELLAALDNALAQPFWPLRLGRKAFVPGFPVRYATIDSELSGLVEQPLVTGLLTAVDPAWQLSRQIKNGLYLNRIPPDQKNITEEMPVTRLILDAELAGQTKAYPLTPVRRVQRTDVPVSFDTRRFAPRDIIIYTVNDYVSLKTDA